LAGVFYMKFIAHASKSPATSDQLLKIHLVETAALCASFASKVNMPHTGELIGLLHDFGKYSNRFQQYLRSAVGQLNPDDDDYIDPIANKGKIQHSTAGAQLIWGRYEDIARFTNQCQQLMAQLVAIPVASHHSGLIDCLHPTEEVAEKARLFYKRMQTSEDVGYLEESTSNADDEILSAIDSLILRHIKPELLPFVRAMESEKNKALAQFNRGMLCRFLLSCLIDADRLNSAEFESPFRKRERESRQPTDWQLALDALELKLSGFTEKYDIDKRRRQISEDCARKGRGPQQLYTLTVPTGGGKTLASLRFAVNHAIEHSLDRIIYIIPYTSIIDQNARVVRDLLTEAGLTADDWVLEHHSNLEPTEDEWRHKLVTDNWDRPIIFTTLVQFLESIYGSGTRALRRFHPMARSVLIFDEVQNVPIKCTHLFCNALNFLNDICSTTSVLCTATQPALDSLPHSEKGQLIIQPNAEIVDSVAEQFLALKRVDVIDQTRPAMSNTDLAKFSTQQFNKEGSCLVIVNTKKVAVETFIACQNNVSKESLFYLTTNLCAAHREQTLEMIRKRLERKQPTLIISTALIEAGVDLSVSVVIRALTGLDSIAQAAGRCNRHAEREQLGKVYVVKCEDETLRGLREIELGQQATKSIFHQYPPDEWLLPETLRKYFQRRYIKKITSDEMAYPIKLGDVSTTLFNLLSNKANLTVSYNIDRSSQGYIPILDQSFSTAARHFNVIEQATQAVIVPFTEGEDLIVDLNSSAMKFDPDLYYKTLRKAQRYSVNLYKNFFDELYRGRAIVDIGNANTPDGLFALNPDYYQQDIGVSEHPKKTGGSFYIS